MTITLFPLCDGPLASDRRAIRRDTIARMAADLMAWDAFHNEDDAFRVLVTAQGADGSAKYSVFMVKSCLRDAIAEVEQVLVAREMGLV